MGFAIGLGAFASAILIIFYLFLILPRVSGGADMELLRTDFAHRGLWDATSPENSLSAFAKAVQSGYGIELDVRLSKDGHIMVFHDETLRRMCGVDRRISDMTRAELSALRLSGTGETIPTLPEVLRLVRGRVPLMIEIKGDRPDEDLCRRLSALLDTYRGAFCIESFSPLIVGWFKSYRPGYARGQLVTKTTNHKRRGSRAIGFLLSHMLLNFISRPDFISVSEKIRKRPVSFICTRIFHISGFVWTVRKKESYMLCRSHGYMTVFENIRPRSYK